MMNISTLGEKCLYEGVIVNGYFVWMLIIRKKYKGKRYINFFGERNTLSKYTSGQRYYNITILKYNPEKEKHMIAYPSKEECEIKLVVIRDQIVGLKKDLETINDSLIPLEREAIILEHIIRFHSIRKEVKQK